MVPATAKQIANDGAAHGDRPICMKVREVFDTFELVSRSPTLDGSLPVRAAQGCKPVLDGNAAGLHLRFRRPATIEKSDEGPVLRLTDEGLASATADYDARIEELVLDGHLARDGYWHRELQKGFAHLEGSTLRVWTGLLVKPEPDTWILVSTAYNRRCFVDVTEYVLSDSSGFVPLIVELDGGSLRMEQTWLDTELATLTPLRPGARMTIHSLCEMPEPGSTFLGFYSKEYLDTRTEAKYAGRYRQATSHLPPAEGEPCPEWQLVYAGGDPATVAKGQFDRFLTVAGPAAADPEGRVLEFGVVRTAFEVSARWDGSNLRDVSEPPEAAAEALAREWAELYGEETFERVLWWASYLLPLLGPHRAEPFVNFTPWVFAVTAPGWSSIADGLPHPNLDPMRGVIATDTLPVAPAAFAIYALGTIAVAAGSPISRILPVPRTMLQSGYRTV